MKDRLTMAKTLTKNLIITYNENSVSRIYLILVANFFVHPLSLFLVL